MKIPESAIELLSSGVIAHVATIDEDGKPQVTCAWVDDDENELRIATMFDQRKLKNMRRDATRGSRYRWPRTRPTTSACASTS